MLRAILNKSWRQHTTKQQLYGHLPPITKTIQVRRTSHAGQCRRRKDEVIRDVLPRTPPHGRTKARRPTRTYIQQLCGNTVCGLEDHPGAMDDRDGWWKKVREIRAGSTTWWWRYAESISSIFSLCMESNASEKCANNIVASRLFDRIP